MANTNGEGISHPVLFGSQEASVGDVQQAVRAAYNPDPGAEVVEIESETTDSWQWVR